MRQLFAILAPAALTLLIADPAAAQPLRYSTYTNGTAAVAVAPDGGIVTAAAIHNVFFWQDIQVTKLDPATHAVIWSRTIGLGSEDEIPSSVAVAADGTIWITGQTNSNDFVLVNPLPGAATSENGAFIVHLSADGSIVLLSSVFGITSSPGLHVAIAPDGTVYWAGIMNFGGVPTTPGVIQPNPSPAQASDGFVARLTPAGAFAATYFGGNNHETSLALAIGADGSVYLAGTTLSKNLPTTAGAFQPTPGPGPCTNINGIPCKDGFVARLSADLTSILYLTYLHEVSSTPGRYDDSIAAIAVNAAGDAFVTGATTSGAAFPVTAGAFQTTCRACGTASTGFGATDAFVARLNATGTALVYSTFLSGGTPRSSSPSFPAQQSGFAIALDGSDNAWVGGATSVTDFPLAGAYQSTPKGTYDAFLARLSANGHDLPISTLLGGTDTATAALPTERPVDVVLTETGGKAVWIAGSTLAHDFPTTPDAFNPTAPTHPFDFGFVAAFARPESILTIDAPAAGNVAPSFPIGGWAIDRGAGANAGIDAIHVYAYPNPGSGAPPIFLGVAGLGFARSDIGAIFGSQFANAGWTLDVGPLASGQYLLAVFARSALTGTFDAVASRSVTVTAPVSQPLVTIDAPGPGTVVPAGTSIFVGGWAIDRGAVSGTGIDAIHIWIFPAVGSPFFGAVANYGIARPDIGAVFGAQFTASGYDAALSGLTPGSYTIVVAAHSPVTGSFSIVQRAIQVQ